MKERLVQLLDLEQITPSKFADIIGVQRSSVSHVISGRNNPSFDFLQKTLKAFPGLNAEWLILGEGTMYEQMGRGVAGTLFDAPQGQVEGPSDGHIPDITPINDRIELEEGPSDGFSTGQQTGQPTGQPKEPSTGYAEGTVREDLSEEQQDKGKERRVVQVMIFYDDDTFSSFKPSQ